jgi:hypothetical protein
MRPRGAKAKERVTYVTRRELLTLIIIVLVAVISLAAWFSYFYPTPSKGTATSSCLSVSLSFW